MGEHWDPSHLFALDAAGPGSPAPPVQRCSPNLTGTYRDNPANPEGCWTKHAFFVFIFGHLGSGVAGAQGWGMVNGPIPKGLQVPGCSRAWQAP